MFDYATGRSFLGGSENLIFVSCLYRLFWEGMERMYAFKDFWMS